MWRQRNRGCLGVCRGSGWSSLVSKQQQPTQQMLASCCVEAARLLVALRVGHTQREGRAGECVHSPVILHNAGQIRLELTAEDIQLDCACHSVASIRASPPAFVFAIATRENTARSVFLCHFHLCRPPAPDFFIIFIIECYMLNIDITGPCKFLMHIVHFSDAITLSDLKNPSGSR